MHQPDASLANYKTPGFLAADGFQNMGFYMMNDSDSGMPTHTHA